MSGPEQIRAAIKNLESIRREMAEARSEADWALGDSADHSLLDHDARLIDESLETLYRTHAAMGDFT